MTHAFIRLDAVAAALPMRNVDTDMILAGRYLKTISREGLGTKLFSALRFDDKGGERTDFILNKDPWRQAGILIALDNFGSGSSREHAPWALKDFGISCIVAPSFADIFYNNCFKNFILPIILDRDVIDMLMLDAGNPATCRMKVDLEAQTLVRHGGETIAFAIAPERKDALLNGIDDIAVSLLQSPAIAHWEDNSRRIAPAIPLDVASL